MRVKGSLYFGGSSSGFPHASASRPTLSQGCGFCGFAIFESCRRESASLGPGPGARGGLGLVFVPSSGDTHTHAPRWMGRWHLCWEEDRPGCRLCPHISAGFHREFGGRSREAGVDTAPPEVHRARESGTPVGSLRGPLSPRGPVRRETRASESGAAGWVPGVPESCPVQVHSWRGPEFTKHSPGLPWGTDGHGGWTVSGDLSLCASLFLICGMGGTRTTPSPGKLGDTVLY